MKEPTRRNASLAASTIRILFEGILPGKKFDAPLVGARGCVIVTGGARGLGLAIAREYVRRGIDVALCSRNAQDLARAKKMLKSELVKKRLADVMIFTAVCDVSKPAEVRGFIDEVRARVGPIDLLVNCAGVIDVGPYLAMSEKEFEKSMNSNFWTVVNTCHAVVPLMVERGFGRIMNVTSIGGAVPVPHLIPYAAAKFGALGFSTGLTVELRKHNVRVTTIVPGLMRTGSFVNASMKGKREKEFALFSLIGNSIFTSMDAQRAARAMVRACDKGQAFRVVGLQAKAQRIVFSLFPNFTLRILAIIDSFLPSADVSGRSEPAVAGRDLPAKIPKPVMRRGAAAVRRFNELRPQ